MKEQVKVQIPPLVKISSSIQGESKQKNSLLM